MCASTAYGFTQQQIPYVPLRRTKVCACVCCALDHRNKRHTRTHRITTYILRTRSSRHFLSKSRSEIREPTFLFFMERLLLRSFWWVAISERNLFKTMAQMGGVHSFVLYTTFDRGACWPSPAILIKIFLFAEPHTSTTTVVPFNVLSIVVLV